MRGWFIIRETEKTYVITKDINSKNRVYLSKRNITKIEEAIA